MGVRRERALIARAGLGALAVLLGCAVRPACAQTIFVDDTAVGASDGTSWADAFVFLQDALAAAQPGQPIWVAEGTYRPDQGAMQTPGDRAARFELKGEIYGGFSGTELSLADRAGLFEQTILSGDLLGDDGPGFAGNGENSYQVVRSDCDCLLDGFTITAGNASGVGVLSSGAGLFSGSGALTLVRCTFTGNSAEDDGGGMFVVVGSPLLVDCTFQGNRARSEGGGFFSSGGTATLIGCRFLGNAVTDAILGGIGGGAFLRVHADQSAAMLGCVFEGNTAKIRGGGVYQIVLGTAVSSMTSCVFRQNAAEGSGGAVVHNAGVSAGVIFTGCTFGGNTAGDQGGGLHRDSLGQPTVAGCIFWGNGDGGGTDESAQISGGVQVIESSCVQGLSKLTGTGNIAQDPLFADTELRLGPGSPCIDAGDGGALPSDAADLDLDGDTGEPHPLDADGLLRFLDDPLTADTGVGAGPVVDMGAFEYHTMSSPTDSLSVSAGGAQSLRLNAGPALAGRPYFVVGSAGGTSPGLPVSPVVVPLNLDCYFLFTLGNPNSPQLVNTSGTLDACGRAQAQVVVMPGSSPVQAPMLHHAGVVVAPTGALALASNAVPLKLTL